MKEPDMVKQNSSLGTSTSQLEECGQIPIFTMHLNNNPIRKEVAVCYKSHPMKTDTEYNLKKITSKCIEKSK